MPRVTIWFFLLLASCLLSLFPAFASDALKLDAAPKPAPAIMFKDTNGNTTPLNLQGHKLTAVHFWATWCAPCIVELPEVDAAAKAYAGKGLEIVAISVDTDMDKVRQFYASRQITTLKPYLDVSNASLQAAGLQGLPDTLFIDKNGKEIARAEGPLDWQGTKVKAFIEGHLK